MSLRPRSGEQVPALTAQIARASNPGGTTPMWVRDRPDGPWTDSRNAGPLGRFRPGESAAAAYWRLAGTYLRNLPEDALMVKSSVIADRLRRRDSRRSRPEAVGEHTGRDGDGQQVVGEGRGRPGPRGGRCDRLRRR